MLDVFSMLYKFPTELTFFIPDYLPEGTIGIRFSRIIVRECPVDWIPKHANQLSIRKNIGDACRCLRTR